MESQGVSGSLINASVYEAFLFFDDLDTRQTISYNLTHTMGQNMGQILDHGRNPSWEN